MGCNLQAHRTGDICVWKRWRGRTEIGDAQSIRDRFGAVFHWAASCDPSAVDRSHGVQPVKISRRMECGLEARDEATSYLGLIGRWRLPSEVEWEYAAKAGTNSRWWFGDRDVDLDANAWHAGNSGGSTREVGLKAANPWGLFDMNGLVNEWCADGWERRLSPSRTQRPLHSNSTDRFVVRGGSWFTESDATRNTARQPAKRTKKSDGLGFRLVWEPDQQA